MKEKISSIITDLLKGDLTKEAAIYIILVEQDANISLFQKNKLDILNWAKSELKNDTNPKLGKTMSPYRTDKILFLNRIVKWINNKENN